jgi:hypothetical protein
LRSDHVRRSPSPWSGLEDIAASQGHWPFVERFLDFGMRHAVKRHTSGIEVPNLDDPNMIRLVGNAPFVMARQAVNPLVKHMLPSDRRRHSTLRAIHRVSDPCFPKSQSAMYAAY